MIHLYVIETINPTMHLEDSNLSQRTYFNMHIGNVFNSEESPKKYIDSRHTLVVYRDGIDVNMVGPP